jgi:signal transduction histidine kinase
MLKAKSLYHLIVYSILFIIVLISFFTFIIISNAHEDLQEKIQTLKNDYTDNQKELIKNHVNYVINFIDYYNEVNKDKKSQETIQKEVVEIVQKLRISASPNEYIFIYDFNGNLVHDSVFKNNIGQNFLEIKDIHNTEVIKELIKASKKYLGGYVEYIWYKPELENK